MESTDIFCLSSVFKREENPGVMTAGSDCKTKGLRMRMTKTSGVTRPRVAWQQVWNKSSSQNIKKEQHLSLSIFLMTSSICFCLPYCLLSHSNFMLLQSPSFHQGLSRLTCDATKPLRQLRLLRPLWDSQNDSLTVQQGFPLCIRRKSAGWIRSEEQLWTEVTHAEGL